MSLKLSDDIFNFVIDHIADLSDVEIQAALTLMRTIKSQNPAPTLGWCW